MIYDALRAIDRYRTSIHIRKKNHRNAHPRKKLPRSTARRICETGGDGGAGPRRGRVTASG